MSAETETITITISKKFLTNLREIAHIFVDEDKDLGFTIEHHASWVFKNLCSDPSDCELVEAVERATWPTRDECETAAKRIIKKLAATALFEISGKKRSWRIHLFDSRFPKEHALWQYCQSEGSDYKEEAERRENERIAQL